MLTLLHVLFRFVLYISALCNDDDQGKKLLHSVMNTLLTIPLSINSESNDAVQSETAESGCAVQDETAESSFTAQVTLEKEDLLYFGVHCIFRSSLWYVAYGVFFLCGSS